LVGYKGQANAASENLTAIGFPFDENREPITSLPKELLKKNDFLNDLIHISDDE
jgi:hypothetical protein